MNDSDEDHYANIREFLGTLIGHRLVDITQHDHEEWLESQQSYIMLHFDNGCYLRFPIGEAGFDHNVND